jgi:uncharacterized protein YegL
MRLRTAVALACLTVPLVAASQQTVFRSSVDAVSVPVSVTDRNKPVAGLAAADFELLDNGVPQELTLTTVDALPTDVTFVVDTSGSVNGRALERIKTDVQEMSDLMQPNDRVRLVSFARDAVDVFGLLPGGARLDFSRMQAGGTTSFYDSLVSVLAAFPPSDRPHMVFAVTDGRDNSSFTSAAHVGDVARASGAVLCVALVQSSNPLIREDGKVEAIDPMASEASAVRAPPAATMASGSAIGGFNVPTEGKRAESSNAITRSMGPYSGGPNTAMLRDAAAATGGLVYPDSSRTPIPQLFRRILDDFRASYVLSFTPTGVTRAGSHTIVVRTKNKNYVVRARKGYEER